MYGVREGSGADRLRDAGRVGDPLGTSLPDLPEEIWHHIHSLLPMRRAARAACVSHAFHRSWRCHPTLIFTKETICTKETLRNWAQQESMPRFFRLSTAKYFSDDTRGISEYNNNIDHVLANHRGAGVKEFVLRFHGPCTTESYNRLNGWLQIAITPVLEELHLSLLSGKAEYVFPCSLLSDMRRNTIQYLSLRNCVLGPTVNLGLRCLTELELYEVRITGDELAHILSGSFALEKLELTCCDDIICLEIPFLLQRLNCLEVFECSRLEVVGNKSQNMSGLEFKFTGEEIQISFGESCQVKSLCLNHSRVINYSINKLASSVPNLETLTLYSRNEIVNAPMVPSKFLHLKVLSIYIRNWESGQEYDFLSLVSFLDASPSLETFFLSVLLESKYDLIVGDPSTLRQMPEHHHDRLKDVKITGFCPQKSLVELTRHILESATSLKCLILDTILINYRCSGNESDKCHTLVRTDINKVRESVMAIRTYIEEKVPSTVQFDILEPCSKCHDW